MTAAMTPAFIGIDWGTTNRRAMLLDANGALLDTRRDDQGSLACRGRFRPALEGLLQAWPAAAHVPVVMSGMVGSALGWQEVPYLDAEVPLDRLPQHLVPVADAPAAARWFITPGLRWLGAHGRADVMRGEETQILGARHLLGPLADGWLVLPGTHSKWVRLQGGVVSVLRTYLTGELFAQLAERGTLAPLMSDDSPVDMAASFMAGVQALRGEELSHALFGARARVMGGGAPAAGTAHYVSGLLIAAEWRDALRDAAELPPAAVVRVIGEPALAERHALCAAHFGRRTESLDPQAVQQAAWRALSSAFQTP